MTRPNRRPWLAGILSWIVPGLGQLYNGRPVRAVVFYVGIWIILVLIYELMLHWNAAPWNIALPLLILLGVIIGIIADAVRDARRNRQSPSFGPWYVHVPVALAMSLIVAPLLILVLRASIAQAFRIPTNGMAETIVFGDHVLVDKAAFGLRSPWDGRPSVPPQPQRNQVVAFRSTTEPSRFFTRRIVGLPGEEIDFRDKQLYVNGVPASEPFVVHEDPRTFPGPTIELQQSPLMDTRDNFGPYRVPQGMYFALGDNRDNSLDSRFQGPIPAENVVGIVLRVYWSRDPVTKKIRWSRIGKSIS